MDENVIKHLSQNGRPLCTWASVIGGVLTINPNEVNCTHCLAVMERR